MSNSADPRLYWITVPEVSGRIAISARPRGAPHLSADVGAWRDHGVEVVVSMLPEAEAVDAGLGQQAEECRRQGVELRALPIADYGTPPSLESFVPSIEALANELSAGRTVAFHCYAGLGRSPTAAACTLVAIGLEPADAIARIAAARGHSVPETPAQRALIEGFGRTLMQSRRGVSED